MQVELIADRDSVRLGDTVSVILRMQLEPEWHLYWTNPGDAGLAPSINWKLPDGIVALPLEFPVPKRIIAGPLASFGYDIELMLLSKLVVSKDTQFGKVIALTAEVDWLVCKVECTPGEAVLSLSLPVSEKRVDPIAARTGLFTIARDKLPVRDPDWNAAAQVSADQLRIRFARNPASANTVPEDLFFYPNRKGIIENAAKQRLTKTTDGFELLIARNLLNGDTLKEISGMLVSSRPWVLGNSKIGLEFTAPVEPMAKLESVAQAGSTISWWQAIIFAFLGGIILNLMPCVLPVLSIKVLSFVQQAGEGRRTILQHSAAYTLGIMFSFWVLAATLLVLRAGGEQLGWGFQLQSPVFIVILASFMFLMGLNLLGIFEVGASLTGVGAGSRRAGLIGSFVAGITTTIVATPCTAPFMGSALGYSLTQPAMISLAIFTAIGLGTAAPFVILTGLPWMMRFVPKPGRWMETFKHAMGFLLMASVIWLIWVLSLQGGGDAVLVLLAALLILGIAAWVLGRWGGLAVDRGKRIAVHVIAALLAVTAISAAAIQMETVPSSAFSGTTADGIFWEPFSPERVIEIQGQGKPLLIDFTAAWCLSCKVNERVAFGAAEVQDRLKALAVVTMKADWTSRDQRITRALAQFGRNSVPLYVLYSGKTGEAPVVFPELLTPGIVIEALNKLEG